MDERDQIASAKEASGRGDFAAAVGLLRPLAQAGSVEAAYDLGYLALTECELVSGKEAFACFQAAARHGHAAAMYHLATFPEFVTEGFSSPLSTDARWKLLIAAAEAGNVPAQRDAGSHLATGDWEPGSSPDLPAAVGWYTKAAAAGNADAQFNLATMLLAGEGCERNVPDGLLWLDTAAAQGHSEAVQFLEHIRDIGVERI